MSIKFICANRVQVIGFVIPLTYLYCASVSYASHAHASPYDRWYRTPSSTQCWRSYKDKVRKVCAVLGAICGRVHPYIEACFDRGLFRILHQDAKWLFMCPILCTYPRPTRLNLCAANPAWSAGTRCVSKEEILEGTSDPSRSWRPVFKLFAPLEKNQRHREVESFTLKSDCLDIGSIGSNTPTVSLSLSWSAIHDRMHSDAEHAELKANIRDIRVWQACIEEKCAKLGSSYCIQIQKPDQTKAN